MFIVISMEAWILIDSTAATKPYNGQGIFYNCCDCYDIFVLLTTKIKTYKHRIKYIMIRIKFTIFRICGLNVAGSENIFSLSNIALIKQSLENPPNIGNNQRSFWDSVTLP